MITLYRSGEDTLWSPLFWKDTTAFQGLLTSQSSVSQNTHSWSCLMYGQTELQGRQTATFVVLPALLVQTLDMHIYVPFPDKERLESWKTPTDRTLPHISQWRNSPRLKNIPALFMIQVLHLRHWRVSLSDTATRNFVSYWFLLWRNTSMNIIQPEACNIPHHVIVKRKLMQVLCLFSA